jgi:hypothetical protein
VTGNNVNSAAIIQFNFNIQWNLANMNPSYEGESVNRSQIDIERETYDIRTWKIIFI